MDVSLHFHGIDQFLDLSGRMRNKLYKGEVVQYSITYQDTQLLERNDVQKSQAESCLHDSYDQCLYTKANRDMLAHTRDKCTAPWIPNNENICTNPDDVNRTYWIWRDVVTHDLGQCHIPCHFVSVIVDAKDNHEISDLNSSYAVSSFYFPSVVTKNMEHEIYCIAKVFAEIGGYLSLFLGYSLLGPAFCLISWVNDKIKSVFWLLY